MFTILPRPLNGPHPNTDSDDFVINKFERVRQIFQSRSDLFREQLLQKENSKLLLDAFPRAKRRYRYHSVISVSIDDITSSAQNFRFLKKMKQKSDCNSEFLLADCIDVYESLQEGLHKDIVYNLLGLVIQLKDTDVARLRELECEKIFRKIQALLKDLNCPRRERTASIDYQYREEYLAEKKEKSTTHSKTQFLLARFEFIIATLGHFIHYHTIGNAKNLFNKSSSILASTPQKKTYNRAIGSRGSVFNSVFTSMETKSKKDLCEVPKHNKIRSDLRSVSRKESLEGFSLAERIHSKTTDADESLKESKFQQVKAYFKWKLEKWKDQDLEEIVTVCRICSKSMSAKIMKKHSPHCKQVAEEEKALKEISKRMTNVIHAATKERHNVNVELIIEKKQLVTLREQSSGIRELDDMGWNRSPEASPMLIKNVKSNFTYEVENMDTESKPKDKVQIVREELKTLDAFCSPDKQNINPLEVPRLTFTAAPIISFQDNNNEEPISSPEGMPECHIDFMKPRLSRQSSKDSLRSSTQTSHRSKSQSRAEEAGDEEEAPLQNYKNSPRDGSPRFMPKLNIITKSSIFAKEKEMQTFSASAANFISPSTVAPASAGFFSEQSSRMLRRSQTPIIHLGVDSPTYPSGRKSGGRRAETRIDSKRKGSEDNQTLITLREKLGRIKFLQTLIKGYDVLINYANIIDNFNEFNSEARIVYEEGKAEAGYFTGKVIGNRKFEEYTQEFLGILTEKLEILKSIDMSKRELRMLELAPETSESNREDSGTVTYDGRSSLDSFEMISHTDLSPGYPRKKSPSFSLKKAYTPEADKRKFTMSPEGSPMIKRTRKLRSKSVEKPATNLRYELFEKNIQKVIKKIKQGKIQSTTSITKFPRSQFYRNSTATATATLVFEEDQTEELCGGEKSPTEIKGRARTTSIIASIQEKVESKSDLTSESSDSSDDSEISESEDKDNVFNGEQLEKSFFSDDESNLKKCAKMQEDGFSSIIGITDFEFIKLISKGAYGRVWLVQRKITGDYYAMKIINFADRKNMNQIDSLKKEKKVFEVLKGDFVVKATFTFVHNSYLCIVMELMIGGDFNNILESFGALEEDVAKFYIAEIVLALSNLHQLGIVHRDLKPDNILLNKNGHIKLTDFGLSEVGIQKQKRANKLGRRTSIINSLIPTTSERKIVFSRTSTTSSVIAKLSDQAILHDEFSTIPEVDEEAPETATSIKGNRIIGTPDYMAPEVINGTCYDDSCIDWWSVGVILFEFIVGIPPFNDSNMDVVFENILKRKIPWDELQIGYGEGCVTPEAKDLIDRLLETDRTTRLGARGVEEIQKHPFFKEINWDELLKSKAPIIPETENEIDVRNFRKETKKFTECELENPFHDKSPQHNMVVSINKETFEFARLDILHEENQKVVEEATNTISQEELEKMRKDRLKNRKWSVFD